MNALHIVNHSHLTPRWRWLQHRFDPELLRWSHHSSEQHASLRQLPVVGEKLARLLAAARAVSAALSGPIGLLVSHGPRPAYYAARLAQWLGRSQAFLHLAYSFNFTELPQGRMRRELARSYACIDRLTVFSELERRQYARHFDLDPDRIDRVHWGASPPELARLPRPAVTGRYICAVGSQGRDYATLLRAARLLPHIPVQLVVHRSNLHGLEIPAHVSVHTDVPIDYANALIAHSEMVVLPLRHAQVPCGHVTAVSAMHLGRPLIATDSAGLHDYLQSGSSAELVEAGNPVAMARAIEHCWEDPGYARRLGTVAREFARQHCSENNTASYLSGYVFDQFNITLRARLQPGS